MATVRTVRYEWICEKAGGNRCTGPGCGYYGVASLEVVHRVGAEVCRGGRPRHAETGPGQAGRLEGGGDDSGPGKVPGGPEIGAGQAGKGEGRVSGPRHFQRPVYPEIGAGQAGRLEGRGKRGRPGRSAS